MTFSVKTAYVVVLAVFYVSIPAIFNLEEIVFLIKGYDQDMIFMAGDAVNDDNIFAKRHQAFLKERELIMYGARAIVSIWVMVFFFSVFLIRKGESIPYKLHILTRIISFFLVCIAFLPFLIFGKGWPSRVV